MSDPAPPALTALTEADRAEAHRRWLILRAHLEDGVALSQVAAETGIRHRTLQRWLARYRNSGLAGLARTPRADRGRSRFPEPLRLLIEGLALRKPAASVAHVHRQVTEVAERSEDPAGVLPAGQTRGRGKIERYFDTINQMCLPTLPGYAPAAPLTRPARRACRWPNSTRRSAGSSSTSTTTARTARPVNHPRPAGTSAGSCRTCPTHWSAWTCCC